MSQGNHKRSADFARDGAHGVSHVLSSVRASVDSATRELQPRRRPVHLSPKAFDLLQILIERRPALVTKAELQDRLWPDVVVARSQPRQRGRGDPQGARRRSEVAAVHRDGVAPRLPLLRGRRGDRRRRAGRAPHGRCRWWLIWRGPIAAARRRRKHRRPAPAERVWINAGSVSRVHARIVDRRRPRRDRGMAAAPTARS